MRSVSNYRTLLLVAGVVAGGALGCAASHPVLHDSFGVACTMAQREQVLDPGASEDMTPVARMNGRAAEQAVKAYTKTFEPKAAQKNAATSFIGFAPVGGGGS